MDTALRSLHRLICVICLLPAFATAGAAEVRVEVEGLRGEELDTARASLSMLKQSDRDLTPAQIRSLFAAGKEEIRRGLEPFGYYNAQVQGDLRQSEGGFQAVYRVSVGDPVRVRHRKLDVQGDGAEMQPVKGALRRFAPQVGEPLDHA